MVPIAIIVFKHQQQPQQQLEDEDEEMRTRTNDDDDARRELCKRMYCTGCGKYITYTILQPVQYVRLRLSLLMAHQINNPARTRSIHSATGIVEVRNATASKDGIIICIANHQDWCSCLNNYHCCKMLWDAVRCCEKSSSLSNHSDVTSPFVVPNGKVTQFQVGSGTTR